MPHSSRPLATLGLLALLTSACTTVETQSFRTQPNAAVESTQVAVDADFSRYTHLMAEDMGIYFPESSPSTPDDLQRIRDIFRQAFLSELSGYEIVREPAPGAMAVQASLIDFRGGAGVPPRSLRSDVRDMARPGSLVFLMELKDSQSGRVLARAADSARSPTFATSAGAATDWQSVEDAATHWAVLFRRFLDDNLGR